MEEVLKILNEIQKDIEEVKDELKEIKKVTKVNCYDIANLRHVEIGSKR